RARGDTFRHGRHPPVLVVVVQQEAPGDRTNSVVVPGGAGCNKHGHRIARYDSWTETRHRALLPMTIDLVGLFFGQRIPDDLSNIRQHIHSLDRHPAACTADVSSTAGVVQRSTIPGLAFGPWE